MVSLSACTVFQTPLPTPTQTPIKTKTPIPRTATPTQDLVATSQASVSILFNDSCMPPCFLGIIPGETHIGRINEISSEYLNYPCVISDNAVRCHLKNERELIVYYEQTGVVSSFEYSHENPRSRYNPKHSDSHIFLDDVLKYYGTPNYVAVWIPHEETFYESILFYDSVQTLIILKDEHTYYLKDHKILETSIVTEIRHLDQEWYSFEKSYFSQQPWKGYGVYPYD